MVNSACLDCDDDDSSDVCNDDLDFSNDDQSLDDSVSSDSNCDVYLQRVTPRELAVSEYAPFPSKTAAIQRWCSHLYLSHLPISLSLNL